MEHVDSQDKSWLASVSLQIPWNNMMFIDLLCSILVHVQGIPIKHWS